MRIEPPTAMAIVGYTDRLSVAPGETITFMVSCRTDEFDASLVRLRHGDPDPAGPGVREDPLPGVLDGHYEGREQFLRPGSYGRIMRGVPFDPAVGFGIVIWAMPTLLDGRRQAIMRAWQDGRGGYALELDGSGRPMVTLGNHTGSVSVTLPQPLVSGSWHLLAAGFDPDGGRAWIASRPAGRDAAAPALAEAAGAAPTPGGAPVTLATRLMEDGPRDMFTGRLESPALFAGPPSPRDLDLLTSGVLPWDLNRSLVAGWDFARDTGGTRFVDVVGGYDGEFLQRPSRGLPGHRWRGETVDFRGAPDQFAAVHFHEDDLSDAGWEPAFSLTVPKGIRSGFYAARIATPGGSDTLPFVISPVRGRPMARVLLLAPTLTYRAYANEHQSWFDPTTGRSRPGFEECTAPEDRYAAEHRLLSIYDRHSDGTGVCYASILRPQTTIRPNISMPVARAPHGIGADLYLVDWLEERGTAYEIAADEDIHVDGLDLLSTYRVVITGTHPEYWTEQMMAALTGFIDGGGRLMYLGGNGFYWVTSLASDEPHVLEVRRGAAGTGPFRGQPGEVHHSTTGEPGGLWRFRGRSPQSLVGVGFAAMGQGDGSDYTPVMPVDPRAAFILKGLPLGSPIRGPALHFRGPAALEVDRLDHSLGTPHGTILVASAFDLPDDYMPAAEDVTTAGDVRPRDLVRADIVYLEHPSGGAVFSVGSIGWCAALAADGYASAVSKVTGNVLDRFLATDSTF